MLTAQQWNSRTLISEEQWKRLENGMEKINITDADSVPELPKEMPPEAQIEFYKEHIAKLHNDIRFHEEQTERYRKIANETAIKSETYRELVFHMFESLRRNPECS